MKGSVRIRYEISALMFSLSVIAFVLSYTSLSTPGNAALASHRAGASLEKRLAKLDSYMEEAMLTPRGSWMRLNRVPEDMVIYLYDEDEMSSWVHSFPILNDDISNKYVFKTLVDPSIAINSPLSEIGEDIEFVNLGPKWYLLKAISDGAGRKVIGGIEILNSNDLTHGNVINPHLKIGQIFTIRPLSYTGGVAVDLRGSPVFKIANESLSQTFALNPLYLWIAAFLIIFSGMVFLSAKKTLGRYFLVSFLLMIPLACMYIWGKSASLDTLMFSPTVFAGGSVIYSIGAVILINIGIAVLVTGAYMVRFDIYRPVRERRSLRRAPIVLVLGIILLAFILFYGYHSLKSIILNSNINLELYRISEIDYFSLVVYIAYFELALMIPLVLRIIRPAFKELFDIRYDVFSNRARMIFCLLFGLAIVAVPAYYGVNKERDKLDALAGRLSVTRDIALELQLRFVENSIAADMLISKLVMLDGTERFVLNRLSQNYLYRVSQEYSAQLFVLGANNNSPDNVALYNQRLRAGNEIAPGSHFLYEDLRGGYSRYTGIFNYFDEQHGLRHMMLCLEPKDSRADGGYMSLADLTASAGRVVIPSRYSYAKYVNRELVSYKGTYPYPTELVDEVWEKFNLRDDIRMNGYDHYITRISDDEQVFLSRPVEPVANYIISVMIFALLMYFAYNMISFSRKPPKLFAKSYFRRRISLIISLSLLLALVTMATISILFVYRYNDNNLNTMMAQKINSVQAMIEERCLYAANPQDLLGQETNAMLEMVQDITKTDITLYSPRGLVMKTTTPEIYDRQLMPVCMDEKAYSDIVNEHKRVHISRNNFDTKSYFALYAPIYNVSGNMIAIVCAPYTDEGYEFELEGLRHLATVVSVFLILLILARMLTLEFIDRMFRPLLQMGRKMNGADVNNLEYINYDRDDEIATLVHAYNRMVTDLAESTRKLAQAERDKAWSGMARQVAHEIKNPLTPMKLQIQRIIRLKEKNAPNWQDKFDEVANVVLDHIDVLSEIANEFLIFAKVDVEEKVEINLDKFIRDEVMMYEHREGIDISYLGFSKAVVKAPKPQLTRVFVNLLNNATQAIEDAQMVAQERGEAPVEGKIHVILRKSSDGRAYEILVDDNGPGVSEENSHKLFSPNFTTKSGGTGIGLAMCRSILEKCGASIAYDRSFSLGGASFRITYPVY